MAESNAAWGELQENDDELAAAYDTYDPLPEPGVNLILDGYCRRKHIDIQALLKLGARLSGDDTLCFAYDEGLKYRNMVDGRMWSYMGSSWPHLKIVRAGAQPTKQVIVAEGESDGARLTKLYDVDVAIMPAGARYFPSTMADQLERYEQVMIALDQDSAGEDGTVKVSDAHNNTVRFVAPGDGDWCDFDDIDDAPVLPELSQPSLSSELFVPAGVMLEMEIPEVSSWLEHAVLPIGGQLILHGWAKSFKTFLALDLLTRLAQGQDWCGFEPLEEPVPIGIIQFEVTWPYYHARITELREHAPEKQLFDENVFTYEPMKRPELIAGNTQQEDRILNALDSAGIQIVLIDPIRRAIGNADLNAENEVRKMLHFLQRIQDQGITVVATHHDNKEGARGGGGSAVAMTGSGAFAGDADSIVSVELPRNEREDAPRRNLNFLLRNAAALGPRSFEKQDDGRMLYGLEPIIPGEQQELEVVASTPPI